MNTPTQSISIQARLVVPLVLTEAGAEAGPGLAGEPWGQVHLLPDGAFSAQDGRPGTLKNSKVAHWLVNEPVARALVNAFHSQCTPLVIDYEHQSLNARENGKPAPAAGWIEELAYVPGKGVYARVSWTEKAKAYLNSREYRFISPVITFNPQTGHVERLIAAALTNIPAIDGLDAVAATILHREENSMDLQQLIAALGLAESATTEEALASVAALKAQAIPENPDSKNQVSLDVLKGFASQMAALTLEVQALKKQHEAGRHEALILAALADGRLMKAQEAWARDLAQKAPDALCAYLESTQPLAALSAMQSGGLPPKDSGAVSLSAEEQYTCTQLGISPEEFAKHKGAMSHGRTE